jgi:hypothetical protein
MEGNARSTRSAVEVRLRDAAVLTGRSPGRSARRRIWALAASMALAGMLIVTAVAAAAPGREKYAPTKVGVEIAARSVLHTTDMPVGAGWVDVQIAIEDYRHLDPCGRRVDDLVLTGYALSSFAHFGQAEHTSVVISNADVFADRGMLARYVSRTLTGVHALSCLRARIERRATHGTRYISFRAVRLPEVAPAQRAFRVTLHPPHSDEVWEEDAIFLPRGRVLAIISAASPIAAGGRAAKLTYFRKVAQRLPG